MGTVHASDERRKEDTQWIEAEYPAWQNGERIYKINCSGCHNKTAEAGTGPGFGNLWGKGEESLHGGGSVKVDEQYIYDSIMEPGKHIVAGYGPVSKMNSFKGKLTQEDVDQVIAFLKYLDDPASVSDKPEGEVEKEDAEKPAEVEAGETST
jgi:cytochrome c oxidase subunit 2